MGARRAWMLEFLWPGKGHVLWELEDLKKMINAHFQNEYTICIQSVYTLYTTYFCYFLLCSIALQLRARLSVVSDST